MELAPPPGTVIRMVFWGLFAQSQYIWTLWERAAVNPKPLSPKPCPEKADAISNTLLKRGLVGMLS